MKNKMLTILASSDLNDWTNQARYPADPDTRICIPNLSTPLPPKMFFRYEVAVEGYDN